MVFRAELSSTNQNNLREFGYGFGNQFSYWQVLGAACFGRAEVSGQQSVPYPRWDLSEEFSCPFLLAVAIVVH